jgi:uncharacterized protein (DUF305 family)
MKRILFLAVTLLFTLSYAQFITYVDIGKRSSSARSDVTGEAFDQLVMSQLIGYNTAAQTLSQQGLMASQHDDVLNAAQAVLDSRTQETEQLITWLDGWYSVEPDPTQLDNVSLDLKAMMAMTLEYMTPMEGMKMPIDHAFLEAMMVLHKQEGKLLEDCVKRAVQPELKTFCESLTELRSAETTQFKTWYDAGY